MKLSVTFVTAVLKVSFQLCNYEQFTEVCNLYRVVQRWNACSKVLYLRNCLNPQLFSWTKCRSGTYCNKVHLLKKSS